jgi:hypothetical protein
MRKIALVLITLAALPGNAALAQQPQASKPEISDELRLTCREAARKICNPGVPSDRQVFRNCAIANRDKLPSQCSALFAESGRGQR